jgi:hypothetical protein
MEIRKSSRWRVSDNLPSISIVILGNIRLAGAWNVMYDPCDLASA